MEIITWIRVLLGMFFLIAGTLIFIVEVISVFKLDYVLNRMHAAAMGDTLGISLALFGLILISGWNFTTLKMILVLLFLWFASPVSSHLIAKLEVETHYGEDHYEKEDKSGKE